MIAEKNKDYNKYFLFHTCISQTLSIGYFYKQKTAFTMNNIPIRKYYLPNS